MRLGWALGFGAVGGLVLSAGIGAQYSRLIHAPHRAVSHSVMNLASKGGHPFSQRVSTIMRDGGLAPHAPAFPLVMTPAYLVHHLGAWLAKHASVPVYLPTANPFKTGQFYVKALDVGYAIRRDGGYHVALLAAGTVPSAKAALNAEQAGQRYVADLWGLPRTAPWHPLIPDLGPFTPPPVAKWKTIILSTIQVRVSPHLTGTETCWNIAYDRKIPVCQVVWHQHHWALMATASNEPYAAGMPHYLAKDQRLTLLQAQSDVRALNRPLPGQHGQAIIPFGVSPVDSNSTASYELHGARYVIMAMHFDAAVMADHMQRVVP